MNKLKTMKNKNEVNHYNNNNNNNNNNINQHYSASPAHLNYEDEETIDQTLVETMERETQETLLKTFEYFYEQESEIMISALAESRNYIKHSMIDLVEEQDKMKEELSKVSDGKYQFKRRAENSIPLGDYLRRKRGLPPSRNENQSGTYTPEQHISEKMAVEKYLRKKERQKASEMNRMNRELTEQTIEAETQRILNKLKDVDLTKEKERERQMEKIQMKLKGKSEQKNDQQIATEIIENYQDSQIAYERDKKLQQQKFQARLSAARDRRALTPTGRDLDYDSNSFMSRENNNQYKQNTLAPSKNVPLVDI